MHCASQASAEVWYHCKAGDDDLCRTHHSCYRLSGAKHFRQHVDHQGLHARRATRRCEHNRLALTPACHLAPTILCACISALRQRGKKRPQAATSKLLLVLGNKQHPAHDQGASWPLWPLLPKRSQTKAACAPSHFYLKKAPATCCRCFCAVHTKPNTQ